MYQSMRENWTLTVPLSLTAHRAAEEFCREQGDTLKGKQVYLNTLAVYAVHDYLRWLGIDTDLKAGNSWNSIFRTLSDTADLVVIGRGKLECRPVLPEARCCQVPPEVWTNRIGYLVVQLGLSRRHATLLGFVSAVEAEALPLSQLRSLRELPIYLNQLNEVSRDPVISLSCWLNHVFEAGWEAVETLLALQPTEPVFNFRSASAVKTRVPSVVEMEIARGKVINLEQAGERALLFVGLEPVDAITMSILVEVRACGEQPELPHGLQIQVMDEAGEAVMQALARSTRRISLEFLGQQGDRFSIGLLLGDVSLTEAFSV